MGEMDLGVWVGQWKRRRDWRETRCLAELGVKGIKGLLSGKRRVRGLATGCEWQERGGLPVIMTKAVNL